MKLTFFYFLTIVVGVGIIFGINEYGLSQFSTSVIMPEKESYSQMSLFGNILLALAVIITFARGCGFLFSKMNQPPVMGEVIGGILLGPSFVGNFFPKLASFLIPVATLPYLSIVAQIGIVLYMFLIGLELDFNELKKSAHKTMIISHASILLPFILGSVLALFIFKETAPENISFTNFALFMGVSMSVTAFPVLARILADNGMMKTAIGSLALACAAIDDVTAWCLLAFVASRTQAASQNFFLSSALCVFFIFAMFLIVRPVLAKWVNHLNDPKKLSTNKIAFILVCVLISALLTESLGIHAIFGAFLLGVIIPHDSLVTHEFNHKWQDVIRILFLPVFFAYTGMKTQIGLLDTAHDWLLCLIIIAVATLGKLGGTSLAARLLKFSWKDSLTLGILMNTRGLVELIVLNIGLDLGIISQKLFTMLVIMAVVTTFMTGPLLSLSIKKSS